ncbi:unnamed protein product [Arabidopsis halleri]
MKVCHKEKIECGPRKCQNGQEEVVIDQHTDHLD